jgi:hypothetical protein
MHNAITSVGHYGTDHGSCTSHMILPKVRKHISCTGQGLTQSLHCRTQLNSRANSTPSVTHPAQLTGRQRCMHCGCGQVAPCTSIMHARMGVWQKRVPPHPCHPGRHGAAHDPAIAACGCELSSRAGRSHRNHKRYLMCRSMQPCTACTVARHNSYGAPLQHILECRTCCSAARSECEMQPPHSEPEIHIV